MARPPRLELPGAPLHIIQRGINRAACFFGDLDRRFYLQCLAKAAISRGCAVHAYVLMSNHVHLLITPGEKGAAAAMLQDLGRRYVRVINTIHGRTGTLWEGRFRSSLVDTENYLLACHRYIDLNPLRAGIVDHPAKYPWSSHSHYALGHLRDVITEHSIYLTLGQSAIERRAAYRSLFLQGLDPDTLEKIRSAANAGCVLGSEGFIEHAREKFGPRARLPRRGRPEKIRAEAASSDMITGKLL